MLRQAGVSAEEFRTNPRLVESAFRALAQRVGADPEALFREFNLRIRRAGQETGDLRAAAAQAIMEPHEEYQTDRSEVLFQDERGFIRFGPGGIDLTLLAGADRSTFLHEMGHFFLEVLGRLADEGRASPDILADLAGIQAWWKKSAEEILTVAQEGIKGDTAKDALFAQVIERGGPQYLAEVADRWRTPKDDVERYVVRQMHEYWARGFEAYLFEGKAPSPALRGAFARFKAWLVALYKDVTTLKVTLTPEVREIMDRLVATQEEIEAAREDQRAGPMFADLDALELPADLKEKYREAVAEARLAAEEILTKKALADIARREKREYRERRKALRQEVANEFSELPGFKLVEDIRAGRLGLLDTDRLRERLGPELLTELAFLHRKDGVEPDLVAEWYGFETEDDMIEALRFWKNKEARIDAETDARMEREFGPPPTEEEMRQAARDAVHNEKQAAMKRLELEILTSKNLPAAKGIIRQITRRLPHPERFREEAARHVAAMRVADLRPDRAAAAERRAAKEAVEAFLKGDIDAAFAFKADELLNHEIYRTVAEARERVEKIETLAKSLKKTSARERIGKASPAYLEQIDGILERFGFSPVTGADRTTLAEWVESQREEGFDPPIPPEILNEARSRPWPQLSYREADGVGKALEVIVHRARNHGKLLAALEKAELEETSSRIAETVRENAKGKREREAETVVGKTEEFFAASRRLASLAREMDGWKDGGPVWELFARSLNDAADRETVMRDEAARALDKLEKVYTVADLARMSVKRAHRETGTSWTHWGRIMLALNWGSLDSRQKVLASLEVTYGREFQEGDVLSILDALDKRDWDFIQGVWDFTNSYWPKIEALAERVDGVAPEKIEASPIETKFGTYRGGYFPLKYKDVKADAQEAIDAAKRGSGFRAVTAHGSRIQRVRGVKREILFSPSVIFGHVEEVIHDLAYYETLIDLSRVLRQRNVQDAIRDHYGEGVYREMLKVLDDVASGERRRRMFGENLAAFMRRGTVTAVMGFKVATAIKQPLGLLSSGPRIGWKWLARGIGQALGSVARLENAAKQVHEKSAFMRARGGTQVREVMEARNRLKLEKRLTGWLDYQFFLIVQAQKVVDIPTWIGAYEKAIAELSPETAANAIEADMIERKAVALADQAVRDSQGGGHTHDLARVMRGNEWARLFTMFMTYFQARYNLAVEQFGRTNFRSPADVGLLAVNLVAMYPLQAILSAGIIQALRGGDDDDDEKLLREIVADPLNDVVLLREAGGAITQHQYRGPAGIRPLQVASDLVQQIDQGELDEAFWRKLLETAGVALHLPTGQIDATLRGFMAADGDLVENMGEVLVGPPPKR